MQKLRVGAAVGGGVGCWWGLITHDGTPKDFNPPEEHQSRGEVIESTNPIQRVQWPSINTCSFPIHILFSTDPPSASFVSTYFFPSSLIHFLFLSHPSAIHVYFASYPLSTLSTSLPSFFLSIHSFSSYYPAPVFLLSTVFHLFPSYPLIFILLSTFFSFLFIYFSPISFTPTFCSPPIHLFHQFSFYLNIFIIFSSSVIHPFPSYPSIFFSYSTI